MSTITISYRSLKDSANEAKAVARKLDTYSDHLTKQIYNKLNNYGGSKEGNVSEAMSKISQKVTELDNKSSGYTRYAEDLTDLKEKCESTDKSVKSMVSTLTATFKRNHGIRNSGIENTINYFLTSIGNSTCIGRWVNSGLDYVNSVKDYIAQSLEDWWDFAGGEELIKGILVGALEVAIAVCTILAVTFTGGVWAVIVGVAALIGGAIALVNGVVNIVNEFRAYNETSNGDPAMGRRRSGENTVQDTLRRESDSQIAHSIANGIDIASFVCAAISVADGLKTLGKNGLKWVKENNALSKEFLKNTGIKIKDMFKDIGCAVKRGNWSMFSDFVSRLKSDFVYNFNKSFKNFDTFKDGVKSVKSSLGIAKSLVSEGFGIKNVASITLEKIVLPCTTLFTVNKDTPKIVGFMGSQMQIDFYDHVTINSFYSIYDNVKSKMVESDLLADSIIDNSLLKKLGENCSISISVPEICIPKIDMVCVD